MEDQENYLNKYSTAAYKLAIRHYLRQIIRNWRVAVPGLLLTGIGSIFVFFLPALVLAKLLGRFSGQENVGLSDFLPYILLFAGFWTIGELLWRLAMYFTNRADIQAIRQLYLQAMEELLRKDQAFFNDHFAGSLTKRVTGYARKYEQFYDTLAFNVTPNIIPAIFASVVLWHYSPWLVVVLLGMTTMTFVIIFPFIRRRQKMVNARESSNAYLTGYVADVIGNAVAVRSFAHETKEYDKHSRNVNDFTRKTLRSWDYHNQVINLMVSPMYVLTNVIGLSIALVITDGPLSVEAVLVTFTYFATVTRALWEFNQIYRNLEAALSEAAQFTELLLSEPEVKDKPGTQVLKPLHGLVQFQSVDFRYSDGSIENLFDNFTLAIEPGEKVGLVGRSGGGKTTITKLLLRFMDIDDGAILVDGQNIADVTQKSLRREISYVPQEAVLFHRSLMDNIRYGNADASEDEVIQASKLAHADEFIRTLPKGYDTLVGERGVKLSGGQRQRIAIARAILKQAPILLLDEATSALDSESEKYIQEALWKLMEGKTALVIAHRLSTIQRMDRIVVLEQGKIIEEGSHKELLAKKGTYADLWTHQSGGFLEDS